MRTKLYILIASIAMFWSCEVDVFDKQPLDKISDAAVWNDEAMIRAVATNLYTRLSFFEVPGWLTPTILTYSDESTYSSGNMGAVTTGGISRSSDPLSFWNYTLIRDMSTFIEKIADSPVNENAKKQLEGEVRAMRAYAYYEMMKRYGGVPLVDIPIDPFSPIDIKYTERSTEEAIADFIDTELTTAIGLLTENHIPRGRINKWTAYAFKARANLWAASIAKFSTVELNGLVGIPASRANEFYTRASDAAQAVIGSGKYSLYEKVADKAENFRKIFVDDNNNPEVIFEVVFDGVNLNHSWDYVHAPAEFGAHGGVLDPFLDFVLSFENIDGSSTQPLLGTDHLYDNGFEPFENKDPRLHANIFFQGDIWQGIAVETYEGLDPSPTPTPANILTDAAGNYNGTPYVGFASRNIAERNKATLTGFLPKKYLAETGYYNRNESSTNWKVLRLAEMYLIKAEAEFEKGTNLTAAADALNATRERAGISLVDQSTITRNHVRTEWNSETCFEGERWYHLRRWRIAEGILDGSSFKGIQIILHYESGKYYFLERDLVEGFNRIFRPEHYYNPITNSRINNNPDLIENPLY